MRRLAVTVAWSAALSLFVGCASPPTRSDGTPTAEGSATASASSAAPSGEAANGGKARTGDASGGQSEKGSGGGTPAGRKLIRAANLTVVTDELRSTRSTIEKLGRRYGGFLVRSSEHEVMIRVKSSALQQVVEKIAGLSAIKKVKHRVIRTRDVTDKITNYQVRLDNKRKTRKRYLQLLHEANSVEDMLEIERELERINGDIERLEGQLQSLQEQVALSKITVQLAEPVGKENEEQEDDVEGEFTGFSPGVGYTALGVRKLEGADWLHGPRLEAAFFTWRDLKADKGPSHFRVFFDLSLLNPVDGENGLSLLWSGGVRMSFERAPARRWLIPLFGAEAGALVTPEKTAAQITPSAGVHVWSGENIVATVEGGYLVPPDALETLRGWQVDAGLRFTFW